MLQIKKIDMFLGDGMKEIVLVTSPRDQRIFHDERKFHLEVTEDGEVTLSTIKGEDNDS